MRASVCLFSVRYSQTLLQILVNNTNICLELTGNQLSVKPPEQISRHGHPHTHELVLVWLLHLSHLLYH